MSSKDIEIKYKNVTRRQRKISKQACTVLKELQEDRQTCDAEIIAEDEDGSLTAFPIHRVILCSCSPYFLALFTNKMKESYEKEVPIHGVSPSIMQLIVDYAYTREPKVTTENVEALLQAADLFRIEGLIEMCCDFLTLNLSIDNCLGVRKFAKLYSFHDLEKRAFRFALSYFEKLSKKSEEVQELTVDELCELLSNDELNVKNEERVFESIVRWIAGDEAPRIGCIAKLLQTCRLGLLPDLSAMEKIKNHPYIKDRREVKPTIIKALRLFYDLDVAPPTDVSNRPRIPHELLFVVGGWSSGSPTNIIEAYDTRADEWTQCAFAHDVSPRAYHGCVAVDGLIYVIGGFDGNDYFNSVRCFDPETKCWKEVAPMNTTRCYVSVTVLDGCIYAMGGYNGHTRLKTAERYVPSENQWSLFAPMHMSRSDASATSLDGKVYIVGGFNGTECLDNAECYDPDIDRWTTLSAMNCMRSGVSCIGYHGCVYAVGGFNGMSRMNSAERFDPATGQWTTIPSMYNTRSNFAIEIVEEMIFVIGGFDGVKTIQDVECYDSQTKHWIEASPIQLNKSAMSACVVRHFTNIRDYLQSSRKKHFNETSRDEGGDGSEINNQGQSTRN